MERGAGKPSFLPFFRRCECVNVQTSYSPVAVPYAHSAGGAAACRLRRCGAACRWQQRQCCCNGCGAKHAAGDKRKRVSASRRRSSRCPAVSSGGHCGFAVSRCGDGQPGRRGRSRRAKGPAGRLQPGGPGDFGAARHRRRVSHGRSSEARCGKPLCRCEAAGSNRHCAAGSHAAAGGHSHGGCSACRRGNSGHLHYRR
jgi:hypothetical protein